MSPLRRVIRQTLLTILCLGSICTVQVQAACAADNCLRAVSKTADGMETYRSRMTDCAKYQLVTVTPAAVYEILPLIPFDKFSDYTQIHYTNHIV